MPQPLGNCPGCSGDEPFEQVHHRNCPDAGGPDADCPEWACTTCGTAVIMGNLAGSVALSAGAPAGRAVRAA
jgi:hypothetical protein